MNEWRHISAHGTAGSENGSIRANPRRCKERLPISYHFFLFLFRVSIISAICSTAANSEGQPPEPEVLALLAGSAGAESEIVGLSGCELATVVLTTVYSQRGVR